MNAMSTGHLKTRLAPKKIDSPLAKYNSAGQLSCIVCSMPVKSELLWVAHVNGKLHRDNVEIAKREKKLPAAGVKRAAEQLAVPKGILAKRPAVDVPPKPAKSILKNAIPSGQAPIGVPGSKVGGSKISVGVPVDFFDSSSAATSVTRGEGEIGVETAGDAIAGPELPKSTVVDGIDDAKPKVEPDSSQTETIPEGFFDDPQLDAKVRHVEYKDPMDEEYAKFQKSIQEATAESSALVQADEEEDATGRQLDEIDEQLRHWSRVVALEKRKDELHASAAVKIEYEDESKSDEDNEEDEDLDDDELLDWRSKSSKRLNKPS